MIVEKKKFIKKVLESLKNNFSDWKVYKDQNHDYVLENKYNRFKIERDASSSLIKIVQPMSVQLSLFGGAALLRKQIKQICKKYDHDRLVVKYQTLNKLFDTRTVLVLNIEEYAKSKKQYGKEESWEELWKSAMGEFKCELDKSLCGEIIYIQPDWRYDVYMYFEREEDMAFVILKYSDFLKM